MTFRWQQSAGMVCVTFIGPTSKRREDVDIVLTSSNLRAGIRGVSPPSCEGVLFAPIRLQTAKWGFKTSGGGVVSVVLLLEKTTRQPWQTIFSPVTPGGNAGPPETKRVRSTYAYQATEQFELTMVEGDIITVVAEDPSGWWKGELNNVVGVFPSNFSEPVEMTDDTFDIDDPNDFVSLAGKAAGGPGGALLGGLGLGAAINSEMSAKLLKRQAASEDGAAPAQPQKAQQQQQSQQQSPQQIQQKQQQDAAQAALLAAQKQAELLIEQQQQAKQQAELQQQLQSQSQQSQQTEQSGTNTSTGGSGNPPPGTVIPDVVLVPGEKLCVRGTFFYEAQADTELSFNEGDIITILAQDESGWWQGELNGVTGWFPANFTEAYNEESGSGESGTDAIEEAVAAAGVSGTLSHVSRAKGMKGRKPPSHQGVSKIKTWDSTEESPGAVAAAQAAEQVTTSGIPLQDPAKKMRASMIPGTSPMVTEELAAKLAGRGSALKPTPGSGAAGRTSGGPPRSQPPPTPQKKPGTESGTPAFPPGAAGRANRPAPPRPNPKPNPPQKQQQQQEDTHALPFAVNLRKTETNENASPPTDKPVVEGRPMPAKAKPQPALPPKAPVKPQQPTQTQQTTAQPTTPVQQQQTPLSPVEKSQPTVLQQQKQISTSMESLPSSNEWPKSLPEFSTFCQECAAMFSAIKPMGDSALSANVIPGSTAVGMAICSMDGQLFTHGPVATNGDFITLQGAVWPLLYSACISEVGADTVNKAIGKEWKTEAIHSKAPNPWCPAGAITLCSLLYNNGSKKPWEKLQAITDQAGGLAGYHVGSSIPSYLHAKETSELNWATAYSMKASGSLSENVNINEAMDFFFQLNSIQMNLTEASTYAAALANDGICPQTKKKILSGGTKGIWASLSSLGQAHDLQQKVPAIGGESGLLIIVIPHIVGIAVYSPEISPMLGGPAVGCEFLKQLTTKFRFK